MVLGINMQTSFMHPPFGFALFYLRSVAAANPTSTASRASVIEPVTTGQIYWGAVPFVFIQVHHGRARYRVPGMVMHYKGAASPVDPNNDQARDSADRSCRR